MKVARLTLTVVVLACVASSPTAATPPSHFSIGFQARIFSLTHILRLGYFTPSNSAGSLDPVTSSICFTSIRSDSSQLRFLVSDWKRNGLNQVKQI